MRGLKYWMVFETLFLTLIAASLTSSCLSQPISAEHGYGVVREILISEYGYAFYNDTYTLDSTSLDWVRSAGGKWFIGFPSTYYGNLGNAPLYPVAYVNSSKFLNVSQLSEGGLVWFTIDLTPVISASTHNLTLHFEAFFTGIVVQNESFSNNLVVSIVDQSAYKIQGGPSLTKIKISNNTSFDYLPRFFSYLDSSNKTIIEQSAVTYSAPVTCKVKITVGKLPDIVSRILYKRLKLDQLLNLYVEDGYSLNFKTYIPEEIVVTVPLGAHEIRTRDLIGYLEHTLKVDTNSSKALVSVKPRYAAWSALSSYNNNYTFFISYKMDLGSKLVYSEGKFTLSSDIMTSFSNFSRSARIEIYLPLGANLLNSVLVNKLPPISTKEGDGFHYFEISNATNLTLEGTVSFEFYYSLLWAGYVPGVMTGLIGLIIIAVIFPLKHKKKGLLEKGVAIDHSLKEEFAKEYINILDTHKLIQDLEKDFILGNVSRRDYRSKQELLNSKLSASSKSLLQLRARLQELGPPTTDSLKELDALESELQEARNSLREMRALFVNRKISKKSYSELSEKYSREINELTDRIIDLLKNI